MDLFIRACSHFVGVGGLHCPCCNPGNYYSSSHGTARRAARARRALNGRARSRLAAHVARDLRNDPA